MSTEYDLRQRDFFVTRPLGTGNSNPHDVLRTRKALNVTGHAHSPPNPSKVFDPSLIAALEGFQRDWGLEPDSVVEPGGPTEATLELAVQAMRAAGPDGAETLRGPMKVLNQAGLRFAPNPDDPLGPVLWRDRDGNGVPPERVHRILGEGEVSRETDEARRGVQIAKELLPVFPERGYGPGRRLPNDTKGGSAQQTVPLILKILQRFFGENEPQAPKKKYLAPNRSPEAPASDAPVKRTVPMDDPPKGAPPFPADPPPDPDGGKEEFLKEERRPTLTVFPVDEDDGPAYEIYPDMSDALQNWLVQESRGKPDGQQKDLKYIIQALLREYKRRGIPVEHTHGGYKDGDGKYLKERYIKSIEGTRKGSRRSDGTLKVKGQHEDIQVEETLADGRTAVRREADARVSMNKIKKFRFEKQEIYEEGGGILSLPKSKKYTWDEWTQVIDELIREYIDATHGPFPRN